MSDYMLDRVVIGIGILAIIVIASEVIRAWRQGR